MLWHTHAVLGASSVWLLVPFLPSDNAETVGVLMAFAVTGALMPDLDAAESKIKHLKIANIKLIVPLAIAIHRDFGHRRLWHSLWGWGLWTLMLLPLSLKVGWLPVAALSVGYASHLLGDAGTKTGILLLYPERRRWYLLPAKLRVITGGEKEKVVFVLFALLTMSLLLQHI
jgi:inner membrane protein